MGESLNKKLYVLLRALLKIYQKESFPICAGQEELIKSVARAIPSYVMSCFKLPAGMCHEIQAMINRFWGRIMWIDGKFIG